ncbi:MAG: hypothetical protein IT310_11360 [Anaerolineales bacterium]|nr:hypothetical protein [Anaerolineales bacterium]
MKKILILLTALILAACSSQASNALKQNRATWQAAKINHYSFNLNVSCFCAFRNAMPVQVEVQNDQIVSIVDANGTPVTLDANDSGYEATYGTIDRIFSQLETALNGDADEVTVTYDPTYGFPAQIFFDFIKEAIDDEVSIEVSNFQTLK